MTTRGRREVVLARARAPRPARPPTALVWRRGERERDTRQAARQATPWAARSRPLSALEIVHDNLL